MADQEAQQAAAQAGETLEISELEKLLDKEFKVKTDTQKDAVHSAVKTLAQQVMEDVATIPADAEEAIEAIIAELDRKLSEQMDQILHHPELQQLEGTWRGLSHLVFNTETDEKLKIKVFNVSKKELGKNFKKFQGAKFDQSPLFKKIYEEQFGTAGGEPYGCLIGDYSFNHSAPDVAILEGMSQIAAASHAPFITSPDPSLLNLDSWQELNKPRDLTKIFGTADYAAWRSLRESQDSMYLGLAMPAPFPVCPTARRPILSRNSTTMRKLARPTIPVTPGPMRPMPWA
jgi:type VI secretion system protein ImpC